MTSEIKNLGLIHEERRDTDYVLGSEAVLGGTIWAKKKAIINDILTWKDDEPEIEVQKKDIETNACVSFSGDNTAEYLVNLEIKRDEEFKSLLSGLGMIKNQLFNASDRRTAKGSGTDPARGNTVRAVDDYIRNFFFCPEDLWPFTDMMSLDEYYSIMSAEVADFGKKLKPYIQIETKYLPTAPQNFYNLYSNPDQIWDGLQYSPVWASVGVPYEVENGLVKGDELQRSLNKETGIRTLNYGHRITIRGGVYGKYFEVHDSYLNQIVKFAWNYPFGGCKIMAILKKTLPEFIQVGSAILFLGKSGAYANEYIGFGDGDVLKAIKGEYSKVMPREKMAIFPEEYKGKSLFIK